MFGAEWYIMESLWVRGFISPEGTRSPYSVFLCFLDYLTTISISDRLCGQSPWLQNGDVVCFLWGTNWIYICYVEESRPPLLSSGQSSWLHNGDVLCFLWGTNWIYICYVEESRPSLWSSGQSSWLQNGDVLCFLGGMNWIYKCYIEESRRFCGLVVTVPGYRPRCPSSIPGATRFSEK
jgi:hypothetical protein